MNKAMVINTLISAVGGAVIGGGITFLTVKKHFQAKTDAEVAEVRRHYALIRKDENTISTLANDKVEPPTKKLSMPITATREDFQKAKALVERLGYEVPSDIGFEAPVLKPIDSRIFDEAVPDEVVGPQMTGPRGVPMVQDPEPDLNDPLYGYEKIPGQPHIITTDEYFNTNEEWEKATLSYYEDDDTLIDERESIIDDVERYVGTRHLNMFGVNSGDKSVVYVRNAQISTDFEIILEQGKYSVRVLGMSEDEDHVKVPIRRMRDSD